MGRVLVGLPRDAPRVSVAAAAVLGALSPDIDAVLMPFGWDRYLRVHEIGTHSMAGALLCGLLTACIVRRFARSARFRLLLAAACAASLSHMLLDLLSSARLRVGWPLFDAQVSLPVAAMADPWLAVPLFVTVIALRARPARQRLVCVVGIAALAAIAGAKGLAGARAVAHYKAARHEPDSRVSAAIVEAAWATLDTWYVFDRTPAALRQWRTDALGGATLTFSVPIEEETPLVRKSRALPVVQNFLRTHTLGFAKSIESDASAEVMWSDIRYCWPAPGHDLPELECGLWFGAEYDAAGRPIRQFVRIGSLTQTRSATR
jgi:membrane-bound metal-dependent hydrolase YbcI (DUF457 family)